MGSIKKGTGKGVEGEADAPSRRCLPAWALGHMIDCLPALGRALPACLH